MTRAALLMAAAVAAGTASLALACRLGPPARRAALPAVLRLAAAWSAFACGWAVAAGVRPGAGGHAAWGWATIVAAATVGGGWLARRLGRLAAVELAWASLPAALVAVVHVAVAPGGAHLGAASVRALLVLPAVWALCGTFGMSWGLLAGQGREQAGLAVEARLAARFLMAKRSRVLSVVTTISVLGVCLGVWLVLVSLAVLSGFERDLQEKIVASGAHVVVEGARMHSFAVPNSLIHAAVDDPRVVAWTPYVSGEVAVRSAHNYLGASLMGIDAAGAPAVLAGLARATPAALARLQPPPGDASGDGPVPRPGLILGAEMARGLAVTAGDVVQVISAQHSSLTPLGPAPKMFSFVVTGVVATGMWEFDARYAFIAMAPARRFLEVDDDQVGGVWVACRDPWLAPAVASGLAAAVGETLVVSDWQARNANLFSALKLERAVAFVVLVFIILVASFSIVNTLAMSIVERRREIAILKTMGTSDLRVVKLFVLQGLWVGGFGTLMGTLLGLLTVSILARCRFFLPQDIYYIEALPVQLTGADVALVVAAALTIVWDFSVLPAVAGARMTPVEGLRDG